MANSVAGVIETENKSPGSHVIAVIAGIERPTNDPITAIPRDHGDVGDPWTTRCS